MNDRGPRNNFRIIQLSKKAAKILKIKNYGLVSVEILPVLSMVEYKKLKKISNISNVSNIPNIANIRKFETFGMFGNTSRISKCRVPSVGIAKWHRGI